MTNFLQSVFEENYIADDRDPFFQFHVPSIDGEFSVYAPNVELWKQLLISGFLQTLIQIAAAFFIYEGIVKRRGSVFSFIVGWGVFIPASLFLPVFLVDTFDMRYDILHEANILKGQPDFISDLIISVVYIFSFQK